MPDVPFSSPAVVFIHGIGGVGARLGAASGELRGGRLRAGGAGPAGLRRTPSGRGDGLRGAGCRRRAAIDQRGLDQADPGRPLDGRHGRADGAAAAAGRLRCRRARLHQSGLRQRRWRIPDEVRRRPAGPARCRQDHGRSRAQDGRPHDRARAPIPLAVPMRSR